MSHTWKCHMGKEKWKMREIRKVTYSSVNSMFVIDGNFTIIIAKKPKRRYRTIIRSFYKTDTFVNRLRKKII